jgi:RNA polymerase sigma factor for flagellar operon FliA
MFIVLLEITMNAQGSACNHHDSSSNWAALANGNEAARDALILEHLPLVHDVVRKLQKRLSNEIEHDDLLGAGTLGLMDAIKAFNVSRGMAFSTYAVPRIRGSILDDLRRRDYVPRSVRQKSRQITKARETLMKELGRTPTAIEIAATLEVELKDLHRWELEIESSVQVPIDSPSKFSSDIESTGFRIARLIADSSIATADDTLDRQQESDLIQEAMMKLKNQERDVLILYFFENISLVEIAGIFEVTESRISQMKQRACDHLKELLAPINTSASKGTSSNHSFLPSTMGSSEANLAWQELLESGAFDDEDDLGSLMRSNE